MMRVNFLFSNIKRFLQNFSFEICVENEAQGLSFPFEASHKIYLIENV